MIEFSFDKRELAKMQKKFKQYEGLPLMILRMVTTRGEEVMSKDALSGQVLKVRTGRLRGSIQGYVDEGSLTGVVGSGARINAQRVKYANIHVIGKTITPKRAKWLTIPFPEIMQKTKGMLAQNEMKARDFKNTFFYWSKSANLILAQKTSKGIRNLFLLKKSVKIPKRDYIARTSEVMQREMGTIFANALKRVKDE